MALPRLSPQEQEIIAFVELGGTLAIASYAVGILSVQAEHMRESNSRFRAALRVAEQEAVEKYGEPESEVAQYFMKTPGYHGGEAGPERIRFWISRRKLSPQDRVWKSRQFQCDDDRDRIFRTFVSLKSKGASNQVALDLATRRPRLGSAQRRRQRKRFPECNDGGPTDKLAHIQFRGRSELWNGVQRNGIVKRQRLAFWIVTVIRAWPNFRTVACPAVLLTMKCY
jgi:hypothetical protein